MRDSVFFTLFFLSSLSFGASLPGKPPRSLASGETSLTFPVKHAGERRILKTPLPGMAFSESELIAYRTLNHPSLVRYYGMYCPAEDTSRISGVVLHRYNGDLSTLMDSIKTTRKDFLTDRGRLKYLQELAEGLAYMHSQGFSHGDIRASNCFHLGEKGVVIGDYSHVKTEEDFLRDPDFFTLTNQQSLDVLGLAILGLEWMYPTEFKKTHAALDKSGDRVPLELREALFREITHEDGTAKLSEIYHPSNQEPDLRKDLLNLLDSVLRVECTSEYPHKRGQSVSAEDLSSRLLELTAKYPITPDNPYCRPAKLSLTSKAAK